MTSYSSSFSRSYLNASTKTNKQTSTSSSSSSGSGNIYSLFSGTTSGSHAEERAAQASTALKSKSTNASSFDAKDLNDHRLDLNSRSSSSSLMNEPTFSSSFFSTLAYSAPANYRYSSTTRGNNESDDYLRNGAKSAYAPQRQSIAELEDEVSEISNQYNISSDDLSPKIQVIFFRTFYASFFLSFFNFI
jgi:hypothetical protein